MRILRRLVNPQWGAANRTARLRLAFFLPAAADGCQIGTCPASEQRSCERVSPLRLVRLARHLLRYIVTECKHIA